MNVILYKYFWYYGVQATNSSKLFPPLLWFMINWVHADNSNSLLEKTNGYKSFRLCLIVEVSCFLFIYVLISRGCNSLDANTFMSHKGLKKSNRS